MFTVIGVMFGGIAIGFLFRRQRLSWIGKVITVLIWVLLFLLGIEVGGNRRIVEGLATLGGEAFLIALTCVLGSCALAWALWYWLYRRKGGDV
ncbi:MAG TPA: lysine exporter LysO family protein [Bacteroides mediterraneensis]|uniref:LysO family transporter n=1 Tax=Bacteroides mediterraneensis TaxID=1841856 RepID=UPI00260B68DD|nr:LysO family transporter [Bacteroides mediterraneensis]HJH65944.1 lysine exporter LysO family protein [Bacteroides mediterraneensis]